MHRPIRRLHHSAEAFWLELPQQSYHQCDQSSIPSCGEGVFSDERSSVKMKLDNIWKNKLQAQRECTSTRHGESKKLLWIVGANAYASWYGGRAHALFVSKDYRIPKIRIQTRQLGNLLDKRIIVAVDSWDHLSRYPTGHYVRTIGEIGDRDTETEVELI